MRVVPDPAIKPNAIAFGRLAAVEWQVKCLAKAVVALGADTRKLKRDLGNSRIRATDPEFISAFETSTANLRAAIDSARAHWPG
jgi:hypothetical protein